MIFSCCNCGEDFAAAKSTAKWCSDKCGGRAKYLRKRKPTCIKVRNCVVCGARFEAIGKASGQKACSIKCQIDAARKYRADHHRLRVLALETVKENFRGLDLNAMFEQSAGRAPHSAHDLANIALQCVNTLGDRDQLEQDLKNKGSDWQPQSRRTTLRACAECGDDFIGRGQTKTCSIECKRRRDNKIIRERKGSEALPAIRHCRTCGAPFQPKKWPHVYCTSSCVHRSRARARATYKKKSRPHDCVVCGSTFLNDKSGGQLTCSAKCSRARRRQKAQSDYLERKAARPARLIKCVMCGSKFDAYRTTGRVKTCSKRCSTRLRELTRQRCCAERYARIRKQFRDCAACGKSFAFHGRQLTCSAECNSTYRQRYAAARYKRKARQAATARRVKSSPQRKELQYA